jgi:hypothetical protein
MARLMPSQALAMLPAHNRSVILGKDFFPNLISGPFMHGLRIAFTFSLILFLLAAVASWLRGGKYVHQEVSEDSLSTRDRTEALEAAAGAYKTVLQEDDEYYDRKDD